MELLKELKKGDFELDEIEENLDLYQNIVNLREFESIYRHEILIQKELSLFLSKDLPEFIPFFNTVDWNVLKDYKDAINNCEKIDFEKLDLSKTAKNDLNSFLNNSININNSKKVKEKKCESISNKQNLSEIMNCNEKNKNLSESLSIKKNNKSLSTSMNNNKSLSKSVIKDTNNNNKNNGKNIIPEKGDRLIQSTIINDKDFKLKDKIENIEYEPYILDNRISGSVFESDICNYIHDIFYILTSGKVNMMRNKEYIYENIKYELDFQITNLSFKHFLFFLGLLLPNLSNLDSLSLDLKEFFTNEEDIFEKINNLNISKEFKDYEYIDVLGEITLDYLNIDDKKSEQFEKYKKLIAKLEEKPDDNKLFNFIKKNKKIILVLTNGKYNEFYKNFILNESKKNNNTNPSSNNKQNEDAKAKDIKYLFIFIKKKFDESNLLKDKIKSNYIYLLENKNELNKANYEDIIKKYKLLKFSETENNYYKNINSSKTVELLRNTLRKINKNYINKLPNLFMSFLNRNISLNLINEELKEIMNIQAQKNKELYKKLNKQYETEKKTFRINISIYEITCNPYFEKFENEEIKITHYKNTIINSSTNDDTFIMDLVNWFELNSKSKSIIKIIILDNIRDINNKLLFGFMNKIYDYEKENNLIIFYEKSLDLLLDFIKSMKIIKFSSKEDILTPKFIEKIKKSQYIYTKLNIFMNYVDKILNNKIIIDDNFQLKDNYIDNLLLKIEQDLSIFYNYNIGNYNEIIINKEKLRKSILNIANKINFKDFKLLIMNNIKEMIKQKLSFLCNKKKEIYNKINQAYEKKFENNKLLFSNIYYKYFEKVYNSIIKKDIKNKLINNIIYNFEKNDN